MKEIIEQYGKTLLTALIIVLLLALVFVKLEDDDGNKGILKIIGAHIGEEVEDYHAYTDYDVYEAEAQKKPPEIKYLGSSISVGEYLLQDYISAVSYTGGVLPIKVVSVVDKNGNEISVGDDTRVYFDKAGIYTVTVSAVDDILKRTICTIKIPVNER